MKVVFCLNYFMPEHTGGTEVYTWALGKALAKLGHQVTVVIPNFNAQQAEEYLFDGLKVVKYPQRENLQPTGFGPAVPPSGLQAFGEAIRNIAPDIVHIQEISDKSGISLFHLQLLKELKIRIFYTIHIARLTCFTKTLLFTGKRICNGIIDVETCTKCALAGQKISRFKKPLLYAGAIGLYKLGLNMGKVGPRLPQSFGIPFLVKNLKTQLMALEGLCEKIIVVADWYKSLLIQNGVKPDKILFIKQVLPSGTPAVKSGLYAPVYPIKLMFIGRIHQHKGLHLLLAALADLPEDKISIDIFGTAKETDYYKGMRESTENKANVRWCGYLPSADVIQTMAGYDALVLASLTEMSPLVIQEAFAAGIPTIGSDIPAITEQIEDRVNGLLFNFNDPESLKAVLSSVIDNPQLLAKLRERIPVVEDFGRVVDQYLGLYMQGSEGYAKHLDTVSTAARV